VTEAELVERNEELERRSCRAVEGAVRVAKRLRETEEAWKKDTVQKVVMRDALERISWTEHSHGTPSNPKPCAKCIALAALEGGQ